MELISQIAVIAVLALLGGLPTFYLTISMPAMIIYKFYRKAKYGISLMD